MIIAFITALLAVGNPTKLYSCSLDAIHSSFNEEYLQIINRIYPEFFNSESHPEFSGIFDLFFNNMSKKVEIDLSTLGIERIPIDIADKLKHIEHLDLSSNRNISIREKWFSYFFENLKELSLNSCNLTEEDFEVIIKFNKLEKLNISGNKTINCTSADFISILENLTHLDVSNCGLDSIVLERILKNGKNLEHLKFNYNDLGDFKGEKIPQKLKTLSLSSCNMRLINLKFNCDNLIELDLSNNDLSESALYSFKSNRRKRFKPFIDLNIFGSKCKLKILNLRFCGITSKEFINRIFSLEELEDLNISGNIMKGKLNTKSKLKRLVACISDITSLEDVTNFKYLEELVISNNKLDNNTDHKLGCSRYSLRSITANNCDLDRRSLTILTDCPNLQILNLSMNNFSNLPSTFKFGSSKDSLKELNISNCSLDHDGFKAVLECSKLEALNCSWNDFKDLSSEMDCKSLKLKILDIENSQLTFEGLKLLTKFYIESLYIQGNSFENIPNGFDFGNLKDSLIDLNIMGCSLNIDGLKSISNCRRLKNFDCSWNVILNLPSDFRFGDMKYTLDNLDFRNCELNSNIFKAISECTHIKKLDLFGNIFDENFSLGLVKQTVKVIDMSFCRLHYTSLKEITDCKRLMDLNISANNFENIPKNFKLGRSRDTLKTLDINSSGLNVNGLKAIRDCSKLSKLVMINNNIGNVQNNFTLKKLRDSLKHLDVHNCRLNHHFLKAIYNCKKLEYLNCFENDFKKKSQNLIMKLKNKVKEYYG